MNRVLLVSDWSVDARGVVEVARRHDQNHRLVFDLLVPAWLHGIDWAGDPGASCACARRQLEAIHDLAAGAGLTIGGATVGDPDVTSAVVDALADSPAEGLLLCVRPHRLPAGPLDLARRLGRLTGLPVSRVAVPPAPSPATRRRQRRRSAHCAFAGT